MTTIYTIGHSNHGPREFLDLLRLQGINAIADVRSSPYSRFAPQFNKSTLAALLAQSQIAYAFLGSYLGARPKDPLCYRNGTVDFAMLCQTDYFQDGLDRVRKGTTRFTVALMCSEKDPIQCHRMILVSRHLRAHDVVIKHILENGECEDNRDSERRLMDALGMEATDLFKTPEDLVEEAYDRQGERIAYHEDEEAQQARDLAYA
ncbi:MAG: DUF488 domain-containing protein [Candidatus Marinimicrobia bacterium]|nr:DUF488 domain-containing protein [Candidatus Neomarinimicrobiota bacterium]